MVSFQVIAQRFDNQSAIIITSNKSFSDWGEVFAGDRIVALAVLDRLLHRCTVVNIRGESFRLKEKRRAAKPLLPTAPNYPPHRQPPNPREKEKSHRWTPANQLP